MDAEMHFETAYDTHYQNYTVTLLYSREHFNAVTKPWVLKENTFDATCVARVDITKVNILVTGYVANVFKRSAQ